MADPVDSEKAKGVADAEANGDEANGEAAEKQAGPAERGEDATSTAAESKDEPGAKGAPAAVATFTGEGDHDGADGGHEPVEVEADRPPTAAILAAIVLAVGVIIGVVVGVQELFRVVITDELETKVYDAPNSMLRQLRADEAAKLGRYQWASKKDGVVRVPLDRAIALTLADYAHREPAPTAAPAPAPAPTAAPTATPTEAPAPK
jgi:hypothetical protein